MATIFLHLFADRDGASTGLMSTRGGRLPGAAALSAVTGDVAGHCHG